MQSMDRYQCQAGGIHMYLGQDTNFSAGLSLMHFDDSMYYWDVPVVDVEDYNFAYPDWLLSHIEKQYIPSVESGLHAPTKHHHYLHVGMSGMQ